MESPNLSLNSGDDDDIVFELPGAIRCFKSGRIERFMGAVTIPPCFDSSTGVVSKDVVIDPSTGVSARIFTPPSVNSNSINGTNSVEGDESKQKKEIKKLPVLLYFHGGAFCVGSGLSPVYTNYHNNLSAKADVIIVSVEYRLAPEHPLPAAYDDCWAALQWVISNIDGSINTDCNTTTEPWLAEYCDKERIFIAGDSAGANIAHNLAMRAGEKEANFHIKGAVLVHPFFWGSKVSSSHIEADHTKTEKLWKFVCPSSNGLDDPRINPMAEGAPEMDKIGAERLMVCVAEKDFLKEKGKAYYEKMKESAPETKKAELVVSEGVGHVFFLYDFGSQRAEELMQKFVEFINNA